MQDIIGKLWIQTCITTSFWYDILCVLTLVTRKLLVICRCCTHQTTALLLEMPIFRVRAGCEIRLVSNGFKYSLEFLSNKPFVNTYMYNFETTGHTYIWMFSISNDCSTIRDIPCVVQSCMRDPTGELWLQTHIVCSLIQQYVGIRQACKKNHYLVHNYTWQQNSRTLWLHTSHQMMALLPTMLHFIRTKLASYTTHCSVLN